MHSGTWEGVEANSAVSVHLDNIYPSPFRRCLYVSFLAPNSMMGIKAVEEVDLGLENMCTIVSGGGGGNFPLWNCCFQNHF